MKFTSEIYQELKNRASSVIAGGGYATMSWVTLQGYLTSSSLVGYEMLSNKGVANGYAPLNSSAQIDSVYLPSYVDDVLEYNNLAAFPATGETGKIYIDKSNGKQYRWSGSAYISITNGFIASTTDIPEGTNLYFTNARAIAALPSQTGNGGKYLSTDGSAMSWANAMVIGNNITSATAGSVLFAGTGSVLSQNNAKLFYDNTNNWFGINTATPKLPLHVRNGSAVTTPNTYPSFLNTTFDGFLFEGAQYSLMTLMTNGTNSAEAHLIFASPSNRAAASFGYQYTTSNPLLVMVHGGVVKATLNNAGNMYVGGSSVASSTLQTAGSFAAPLNAAAKTGNFSVASSDYSIKMNGTSITVTQLAPGTCAGRILNFINQNATSATLSISYVTFTGITSTTIAANSSVSMQSDGTNWIQIK